MRFREDITEDGRSECFPLEQVFRNAKEKANKIGRLKTHEEKRKDGQ